MTRTEPVDRRTHAQNGEPQVNRLYDFWKQVCETRRIELKEYDCNIK